MSKYDSSLIEHSVQKLLRRYFPDETPFFVLGVSGGVDSMSLLYIFKKLGIDALVSHVNYQKRGEASDKDAELVEGFASAWDFECHVSTLDVPEDEGINFQQWARQKRYDIYRGLVHEYDADGIAVAHHEDDQVETILQKLFRGAGLASWSSMEVWDGEVFRPYLHISRSQIEEYAGQEAIPYRTDESNLKSGYARNFLRNEWLQQLKQFFPGWKKNVLRIVEQAKNYEDAVKWIAGQVTEGRSIRREAYHTLEPGLQRALILWLAKQQNPELTISQNSLWELSELKNLQTGQEITLTPKLSVMRDRDCYVLTGGAEKSSEPLVIERFELESDVLQTDELIISLQTHKNPDFETTLFVDADKIAWPVTLRPWRAGDRFQPLGMEGHQLVADHLTNRKVSAAHKGEALVMESFEETICAIIFPPIKNQAPPGSISEQVKCDSNTAQSIQIKYRS